VEDVFTGIAWDFQNNCTGKDSVASSSSFVFFNGIKTSNDLFFIIVFEIGYFTSWSRFDVLAS